MQKKIYKPGQRLKDLRKMKGITQRQVADMLCYADEYYISLIETGRRKLTQDKARILAQHYPDVSVAWLMGDTEYMNATQHAISIIQSAQDEMTLMLSGLSALANLAGFKIIPPNILGPGSLAEDAITEVKRGFLLEKDGTAVPLVTEDLNHMCEIVGSELNYLFVKGGEQNG